MNCNNCGKCCQNLSIFVEEFEALQKNYPKECEKFQSTGISFGLDVLSTIAKLKRTEKRTLVLSINQDKKAIELAQKLRASGKNVIVLFGKPTKALDYANAKGIQEVIFLGKEEVKKGKYKVRDMGTGKEKFENI